MGEEFSEEGKVKSHGLQICELRMEWNGSWVGGGIVGDVDVE